MTQIAPDPNKEREMIAKQDGVYKGGFLQGDPMDPYGLNEYAQLGFMNILYAVYQVCIKPYAKPGVNSVEIGPGTGAFTKAMLPSQEVWCLDAQSAEDNRFWEYIGPAYKNKVKYFKVTDFACSDLPDNHFDFLFSFGCFCHMPWEGQSKYYANLYRKLRRGANAMIMFADDDKWNAAIAKYGDFSISIQGPEENAFSFTARSAARFLRNVLQGTTNHHCRIWHKFNPVNSKVDHLSGRQWDSPGIQTVCDFLQATGYEVVNPDVGLCIRDPIIHFRKP
jgi:hypothetical protein